MDEAQRLAEALVSRFNAGWEVFGYDEADEFDPSEEYGDTPREDLVQRIASLLRQVAMLDSPQG
jgi:hypothetical protein